MAKSNKKVAGVRVEKQSPELRIQINKRLTDPGYATRLKNYADAHQQSASQAVYSLAMMKLKEIYTSD